MSELTCTNGLEITQEGPSVQIDGYEMTREEKLTLQHLLKTAHRKDAKRAYDGKLWTATEYLEDAIEIIKETDTWLEHYPDSSGYTPIIVLYVDKEDAEFEPVGDFMSLSTEFTIELEKRARDLLDDLLSDLPHYEIRVKLGEPQEEMGSHKTRPEDPR